MKHTSLVLLLIILNSLVQGQKFTIVVIPDTQMYASESTWYSGAGAPPKQEMYTSQMEWIVQQKDALNIAMAVHVGDIVDYEDNVDDWLFVSGAQAILDQADIPNGIAPGNHDVHSATSGGYNYYTDYFPANRYEQFAWYGGSYENNMNSYQLFTAGGMDFIALHIRWNVRYDQGVIDWANQILAQYQSRRAIVVTHAILEDDGNVLWNNVVKNNDNVFWYIGGHTCGGLVRQQRTNDFGHSVQQLMVDYQCEAYGGDAKLAYYEFDPANNQVCGRVYSTYKDYYVTDGNSQFCWTYDMEIPTYPVISEVSHSPEFGTSNDSPSVQAKVTDDQGISTTVLKWGLQAQNLNHEINMAPSNDIFSATLPSQADGVVIYYQVVATDSDGQQTVSEIKSIAIDDDGSDLPCPHNQMQSAYHSTAVSIPGIIEFEAYNQGCNGVAYYDNSAGNAGNGFRNDDGDIEECSDQTGGYNLGWTVDGEWYNYSVDVAESGVYEFALRTASGGDGSAIHFEIDNQDITGSISIAPTGGWQEWQTVIVQDIDLSAGEQDIKLVVDVGNVNLNNMDVQLLTPTTNPIIANVVHQPNTPSSDQDVVATAAVSDDTEIQAVNLSWGVGPDNLIMHIAAAEGHEEGVFAGTIPAQSDGTTVYYQWTAIDEDGNETTSSVYSYMVSDAIVWTSYDIIPQEGSPMGVVSSGGISAEIDFYESSDDFGVGFGNALTGFNAGDHNEDFNNLNQYWGTSYPYAGKSNVIRGNDEMESEGLGNGAYDLQLHPPNNDHLTVARIQVPLSGNYTLKELGARRVSTTSGSSLFKVFDQEQALITTIQANSTAWNNQTAIHELGWLNEGDYLYFAVDRDGDFSYDATEITWKLELSNITTTVRGSMEAFTVSVYPNLLDQGQNLNVVADTQIESIMLLDAQGRTVYTESLAGNSMVLNTPQMGSGVYSLSIRTAEGIVIRQVVVR